MKIRVDILSFVPLFLAVLAAGAQASSPYDFASSQQMVANYGKLPLGFEPNFGQTGAPVQFVARGAGYTIFLSPGSATFLMHRHSAFNRERSMTESAVVRMDLVGASHGMAMQPEDKLPGVTNYLTGNGRDRANLPNYAKLRSRNVYPGIDLVYYGTQGQLEYDFVLGPGADPSRIRMTFAGATPVVDQAGDLVLSLAAREGRNDIRFHRPLLYQRVDGARRPVNGRFTITGGKHEVRFQVDRYDHSRELVIDPVLIYSSYLGGSSVSQINAIAVNAAGQIYVTGATQAINFPTTTGVIESTCPLGNTQLGAPAGVPKCGEGESGTPAAFVSKISADGQSLIYSTYLGGGGNGAGSDLGTGIAVDANDNAWVVGQTGSNDFPVTADAYLAYCNPGAQGFSFSTLQNYGEISTCVGNNTHSVFLVHLNPTGTTMLYGTFLGGTGDDLAAQIVLDAAGNIYVAGSTYTAHAGTPATVFANDGQFNYPTTPSAYQPIVLGGGSYSAFVTKLASNGKSLLYSTMFSAPNQNTVNNALAVNAGKIFIGGYTQDPHLPTSPGAISSTCVGGPTAAGPNTVCINGSSNGYVAGFDPAKSGAASLVFSTYLNGSVSTQGNESSSVNALAADAAGNVYVGGQDTYTVQEGFPTTTGVLQPTCLVAHNSGECGTGFVIKLNPLGGLAWSTFYGSPSTTGGQGVSQIALDSASNVYIAANSQGIGDYPLNNGFQTFSGGGAYIAELNSSGSQVLFGSYYGGNANTYPTGLVVDPAGNIYLAGYTNAFLPLVSALQSNNYGGGFPEGFFAKISSPTPSVALIANAESQSTTIGPNTWIEIKGSGLASTNRIWLASDFVNNQMPTTLDGVSVTMNGESAYIYYVSPSQLNVLTPPDLAPGTVQVIVKSGAIVSAAFTVQAQAYSPSFFVFNGGPYVIGAHLNGGDLGPASLYPGLTTPAQPGELVVLFANGFGPVSSPVLAGAATQSGNLTVLPVIQIGGVTAVVQFAGLVSPGLFQFNVYVPMSAANGDNTLTVQYNGLTTQTGVLLTVQR